MNIPSPGAPSPAPCRLPWRRRLVFAGAVLLAALTCALTFGEWYCRSLPLDPRGWYELTRDPVLFYRLAAGVSGVDGGNVRTQTAQRLRGPLTFSALPPEGAHRVLWIGDSACFGHGVADEETAAMVLPAVARANGVVVESINLGVVGYNVRQAREVLTQRGEEFRGAKAIVYFRHLNDIVNAPWTGVAPHIPSSLFWSYERPAPVVAQWAKRSALVTRLAHTQAGHRLWRWLAPAPPDTDSEPEGRSPAGLRSVRPLHAQYVALYTDGGRFAGQFRDELNTMAITARERGAALIVVYWPTEDLLQTSASERVIEALAPWCATSGATLIDMTAEFVAAGHKAYADATHPGETGHRLIAERVWSEVAPRCR
ncbi:MAG: SGNH/GDSL hydrolase family protein [Planctomycetes bacterium]|nr:SGNH/GDSL hydrolase family protein [Planctomycetota bacterium]